MTEILLIRHGKTAGNQEGRYIGCRTDLPLCAEGIESLKALRYPEVEAVFASPMKRCLETAALLWPAKAGSLRVEADLRECDFGRFENKTWRELSGEPAYQAYIDSGGETAFSEGEEPAAFRARCCEAFLRIVQTARREGLSRIAVVAHGGTVMSVMERFSRSGKTYFDYMVHNGCGYRLTVQEGMEQWDAQPLP